MRKSFKNFLSLFRLDEITSTIVENVNVDPLLKDEKSSNDALLHIIYAKDSTGLPTGDLQYFVNPKANPEVKKFILDNLMMDVSSVAAPKNSNIDNDTVFALMRKSGETLDDYMQRINDFGKQHLDIFEAVSKLDVSTKSDAVTK